MVYGECTIPDSGIDAMPKANLVCNIDNTGLTKKEKSILFWYCSRMPEQQIADEHDISMNTLKTYVTNLDSVLDVALEKPIIAPQDFT